MANDEKMDLESRTQILENLLLVEDFFKYGFKSGKQVLLQMPEPEVPTKAIEQGPAVSAVSETQKAQLDAIHARVQACTACSLSDRRSRIVFGEGVLSPKVLVIGEGPGAEEDRQGLPFVGASGKLLDKMLESIGLSRHENCYIGNIVKCRPPNNREPTQTEREACIGYLRAQIEILRPQFILCVGRTAAHGLLEIADPISRLRGRSFDFEGIPVRVTFHPSALLRDASLKRPAWEDLKQLRALMDVASDQAPNSHHEE
jgi:DNA polymerase